MTKAITLMTVVLLGGSGAIAQPPVVVTGDATPFKVVSYADLNISSKAGQNRLESRIRAAASDLCLANSKEELKFAAARRTCFVSAYNGGLEQMQMAVAGRSNNAIAAATLIVSTK